MQVDLHQHIWTESLLDALEARTNHPFVRRDGGLAVVHCATERPYVIEVASESPNRRAALLHADGLDLALIAISSPIGIEALPHDEAHNLIGAHLDGVAELGEEFSAWGPIAVDEPDPDDVDAVLDRGCLGVSLPAACLAGVEPVSAIGYVLERIAARGVPLLIHPGPGPGQARHEAPLTEAQWWRAMTDYVAQMHAAWLTFAAFGRREHPTLRIVFAMLAGGAPLISERLQARGGPGVDIRDPLSYYETSSYGPRAVDAMARWVGDGQLVYGSDRPVIEPTRTGREKLLQANAAQLVQMRVRDAGARGVEVHA
ncbi:MAG: amidohydrolase family protein [Solirubrobacterales bacterium]|nr:amidohydrolase family protein [Solirubrobacterales bacterium]